MRNIVLPLSIAFMSLLGASCTGSSDEKAQAKTQVKETKVVKPLAFDSTKLYVGWTAFKTTDSVEVSGVFNDYQLKGINEGDSPEAIFSGSSISIKTSSVDTKNAVKNSNIFNYFFSKFQYPEKIDVVVKSLKPEKGILSITMNNITNDVEVTPSFKDRSYVLEGLIDLRSFKVVSAADSLNYHCSANHAGADGIVKLSRSVYILVKADL